MKSLSFSKCILLLICLTQGVRAIAQTPDANGIVYVKPAATGTGDGSSWTNATANLHQAIHAAGVSKVFVAIGTYKVGAQSIVMKNNVEIYGGFNPAAGIDDLSDTRILPRSPDFTGGSVLDGEGEYRVISNECSASARMNNTAVLDGFTIANGYSYYIGGGVNNYYASPTLRNLLIKNNFAFSGGGIFNEYSSPVITNTIFLKNYSGEATAMRDGRPGPATMILTNVLFVKNEAVQGYLRGSNAAILETRNNVVLNNVTIVDNYGLGIYVVENTVTIQNSIILGGIRRRQDSGTFGSYTAKNSLIEGDPSMANGNLDASSVKRESIFNNPNTGDYTLKSCSPAINAGNNALYTGLDVDTKDLAGNSRLINGTIDIGAFETENLKGTPDTHGVIYVKTAVSGNGSGDSWANATDNLRAAVHLNNVQQVWVAKGNYLFDAEAGTWDILNDVVYTFGDGLVMKNNVAIYGGFDPDNGIDDLNDSRILPDAESSQGSIISGDNLVTCVLNVREASTALDNTAILDGFTLTAGRSRTDYTLPPGRSRIDGAGIANVFASPTLRNLVIRENSATHGGGIFNLSSSPAMSNMTITNNTATNDGGGIYNDALSSPLMSNIKITANKAEKGAGMFNRNSSPVLKNADITGNIASTGGGAMSSSQSSAPKLINVTMAGNTPDAFASDNAVVSLTNSIVFGATSGTAYTSAYSLIENNNSTADGNVDATGIEWTDVFTDPENQEYTLKTGSPAANKGNNTLYAGLDENTKDPAGNDRVHSFSNGGVIDLGAYEGTSEVVISPDINGIVYVKTLTAGNGSGTDWENPTNSVQKAIDAVGTQKVFVATGNYNVPSPKSFVMKYNVAVYGGFDPDNGIDDLADPRILPNHGAAEGSVLNGINERPVVWNSNNGLGNTAILDGFTITGGYSNISSGAGIMNDHASPTLRNLVISENNTTLGGGGIFNNYSSPVISDVIIKGNTAGVGGGGIGSFDISSPVLTNVQITGNTAPTGAGVWFAIPIGNATLTNVTIAGNLTGNGATIISGGVSLKSSIVYGGVTGTYSAQYSLIEGSTAETNGNMNATGITLTNLFADHANGDFTLAACSPVTNAGVPDALNLPVYDLAGNSRIFAGRIDMGAYENTNSAGNPGIASIPGITSMIQTANGTTGYYNSCNEMLASVITTGAAGSIEGMTTAKVWIDDTQQTQYVRRHYEITPEQNAATASGRITLYFTQADFDAFNTLNPTAQLPDGPSGSAANLLIEKRGGASTDGTGLPSTYPGTTETISNVEVIWNSTAERWEVSFSTTGFSGFFVKTTLSPLPVRWISFTAHLNDDKHGVLEWKVDQTNVADYQIERSSNARDFRTIGRIAGSSNGISQYHFIDPIAVAGTFYYRIRQTDLDGTFAYSRIESVSGGETVLLSAYPNPTRDKVTVQLGREYIGTRLRLVNLAGVELEQLTVREETFEVNLDAYPAGVYILYTFDGKILRLIRN